MSKKFKCNNDIIKYYFPNYWKELQEKRKKEAEKNNGWYKLINKE